MLDLETLTTEQLIVNSAPPVEVKTDNVISLQPLEIEKVSAPQLKEDPVILENTQTEKPELSEEEQRKVSERTARMFVNLSDVIVSRVCDIITGEGIERYKMSKIEREDLTEATTEYFVSTKAQASPVVIFSITAITIFSGIFMRAYADYKKKKKEEQKKADQERQLKIIERQKEEERQNLNILPMQAQTSEIRIIQEAPAPKEDRNIVKIHREEIPEAINKRSNFKIYTEADRPQNANATKFNDEVIGRYAYNSQGERYTIEECLKADDSKPSPLLERMILQYLKRGTEQRIINKELRQYLKNLPSFDE